MVSEAFKPGDLAKLKSGGPTMSVATYDKSGRAYCYWFVGTARKEGSFSDDSLEPADQDSPTTPITAKS
jgi:uncharacterized protein YodC (DUF2158 family)